MKTKVIKRVVALALAALILLGTLGYFFSMVGYAAEKDATLTKGGSDFQNVKYDITKPSDRKIKATDQVDITITLEAKSNIIADSIADGTVEINTNDGAFEAPTGYKHTLTRDGTTNKYVVRFENIKYAGNKNLGILAFDIKKDNAKKVVALDLSSECETTTPGGDDPGTDDPGTDDPGTNEPALPANMSYTISHIYKTKVTEKDAEGILNDPPKSNCTFFSGSTGYMDPSIKRYQYVNMQVQFAIPGVGSKDIIDGDAKIEILVDRGSFRFPSATEGYIHIDKKEETSEGTICWVTLKQLQYNGTGNTLAFTVRTKEKYKNDEEPYIYQQFSAEVSSCEPYVPKHDNDDDDPDDSRMEMATPYVIVNNYNYGGTITAGDTFPLSITLFNTSKSLDVQNMMVTITMPEAFMLTSSSNTFYIEDLESEGMVTKTMNVTAKANAAPQSHNIEVSMKYQYVDDHLNSRRDNTTQETISIPVVQVDRFQVTGVDVSAESYVGEEASITVNFVNKGRSDVYNLSAEISGDIQNPGQQQNLGNLTSGSTGTADFYVMPNGEGMCSGEIKITYEDTNMEEKEATIQWSTNVVDPMAGMDFGPGIGDVDPGMMEDPGLMEEEKPSWPFIAGGVGAGALVVGLLVWRHIKKKRSEAADADL